MVPQDSPPICWLGRLPAADVVLVHHLSLAAGEPPRLRRAAAWVDLGLRGRQPSRPYWLHPPPLLASSATTLPGSFIESSTRAANRETCNFKLEAPHRGPPAPPCESVPRCRRCDHRLRQSSSGCGSPRGETSRVVAVFATYLSSETVMYFTSREVEGRPSHGRKRECPTPECPDRKRIAHQLAFWARHDTLVRLGVISPLSSLFFLPAF
ncbi:unnamed protein product [Ectocarpus sp. 13 AM-2016]